MRRRIKALSPGNADPDLPARLAARAPLNDPQRPTFYATGPEGLIDYPTL